MQVILLGTPVSYTMIALNNIMRATGYPRKAMLSSMLTVASNVILAPIFIFHFHWGIRGAAVATVFSQVLGLVWIINHFTNVSSYIHFQKGWYRLKKCIVISIFSIGMSPFMMNVCSCMVVIIINNSLQKYGGDLAIGAYGIINRMMTLFVMIVMGLNMGMQPIVGYNFGAHQFDRVKQTLKYTIISGVTITTLGFLCCELFPRAIVSMFTTSKELIELAQTGLRIGIVLFPLVGAQIVITNFFQSIGMAKISIFLSLSRQLVYLLPFLLILPRFWGVKGVWSSMPVSDTLAFVTAVIVLMLLFRKIKKETIQTE